jgi:hypothetical protein
MMKTGLAALAALLCLGTPALAAWDRIGSVDVGYRGDRDVKGFDLGGPVERLQLRAERSSVNCRSVTADFGNGNRRPIFSGRIRQGATADINLPGDARTLRGLAFNCGADERRGATLQIMADVGRYRGDWQRGPNWQRQWSRVFNWTSNAVNDWQLVGSESFEGRGDSENAFTGWRGRGADAVALKPLEADARCSRVTARFDRGRMQPLNVNNGDVLRRGQFYKLDLPGGSRNLDGLTLRCTAIGARRVTIQLFTSH